MSAITNSFRGTIVINSPNRSPPQNIPPLSTSQRKGFLAKQGKGKGLGHSNASPLRGKSTSSSCTHPKVTAPGRLERSVNSKPSQDTTSGVSGDSRCSTPKGGSEEYDLKTLGDARSSLVDKVCFFVRYRYRSRGGSGTMAVLATWGGEREEVRG